MFIVFGILSILAGIFVFRQGTLLSVLSSAAQSESGLAFSGAFLIVAICLILSGAVSCACKNGEKRGFVKAAIFFYAAASFFGFVFRVGDLKIWAVVCLIVAVIYLFILISKKKDTSPQQQPYVQYPSDLNNQAQNISTSTASRPQQPETVVDPRWVNVDSDFTLCPECGKRMSREFIRARGSCPDCQCSYYKTVEVVTEPEVEIEPGRPWIIGTDGFTSCPKCGKRVSLDFIRRRGECPVCKYSYQASYDQVDEC